MRTETARFDVVIVGAGPAGAAAASVLARAGARVAICDPSHPREKPCGGGVTGRALALALRAAPALDLPAVAVTTARFEDERGARARIPLDARGVSSDSALVVSSRTVFDAALLSAATDAGSTLFTERVVDVRVTPAAAIVRTASREIEADVVLGADGANSLVRRRLSVPFARAQQSIATGYFADGVTSREIVICFVADPPGYIWSFPRPDHLAIGICAQADQAGAAALRAACARWIATSAVAAGATLRPYAWPIPSLAAGDFARERPSGPRWLLLGDAAGLVDPITREGIFYAVQSGLWAAELLMADAPRAPERYARRLRGEVYPELRRAARLKQGFFRPAFVKLLLQALARSPRIGAVMADLVAGAQPYRGLERRLLRTFEVGLAWDLVKLKVIGEPD